MPKNNEPISVDAFANFVTNGGMKKDVADGLPLTAKDLSVERLPALPCIYHLDGPPVRIYAQTDYMLVHASLADALNLIAQHNNQIVRQAEFAARQEIATAVLTGAGSSTMTLVSSDTMLKSCATIVHLVTETAVSVGDIFGFTVSGNADNDGVSASDYTGFSALVQQMGRGHSTLLCLHNAGESGVEGAIQALRFRKNVEGAAEARGLTLTSSRQPTNSQMWAAFPWKMHTELLTVEKLFKAAQKGNVRALLNLYASLIGTGAKAMLKGATSTEGIDLTER